MKIKLSYLFILLFVVACSTKSNNTSNVHKSIDPKLVGVWYGNEKDQQSTGVEKKWVMNRKEDGTYTIKFEFLENGTRDDLEESGIWWVNGNKFYEKSSQSKKPDIYAYEVIDNDQIKFKSLSLTIPLDAPVYEFIDNRVK